MYVLERKVLYIPRENLTKNRCFQGYRWKQIALCDEREPLERMIPRGKERDYRIENTYRSPAQMEVVTQ